MGSDQIPYFQFQIKKRRDMPRQRIFINRNKLKNTYPFILLFIGIVFLFLTLFCKTSNPDLAARIQRIEKGLVPQPGIVIKGQAPQRMNLADRMEAYRIPGVSIAVINDFKIEWSKGYGVREEGSNDPVTPKTLFQAASISKPVAAFAALYFVEKGLLDLMRKVYRKHNV